MNLTKMIKNLSELKKISISSQKNLIKIRMMYKKINEQIYNFSFQIFEDIKFAIIQNSGLIILNNGIDNI